MNKCSIKWAPAICVTYPRRINVAALVATRCQYAAKEYLPSCQDRRRWARSCGPAAATLEAPAATHQVGTCKGPAGEGELCDNTGSMLPFAKTKGGADGLRRRVLFAERYRSGDRAALMKGGLAARSRPPAAGDVKGFLQARTDKLLRAVSCPPKRAWNGKCTRFAALPSGRSCAGFGQRYHDTNHALRQSA